MFYSKREGSICVTLFFQQTARHPLISSHFMACLPLTVTQTPFMHSVQQLETNSKLNFALKNKRERAALRPRMSGIRVKVCPSLWQQRMSEKERWNKDSLTWDDTRRVNNSSSTCVDSSHRLSVMQRAVNISAHRTLKHYLCMGRAGRVAPIASAFWMLNAHRLDSL